MISVEQVIEETEKNRRVCPQPVRWNELYALLPDRRRKGNGWEPPLPLILGAWWETSVLAKKLRLSEHISWADSHGALEEVLDFIKSLPEEDWYHGE